MFHWAIQGEMHMTGIHDAHGLTTANEYGVGLAIIAIIITKP